MRGLPFRVTENDIAEWFSSVVDPVNIDIQFNNQGRPTGEADVYFEKYVLKYYFLKNVDYYWYTKIPPKNAIRGSRNRTVSHKVFFEIFSK